MLVGDCSDGVDVCHRETGNSVMVHGCVDISRKDLHETGINDRGAVARLEEDRADEKNNGLGGNDVVVYRLQCTDVGERDRLAGCGNGGVVVCELKEAVLG